MRFVRALGAGCSRCDFVAAPRHRRSQCRRNKLAPQSATFTPGANVRPAHATIDTRFNDVITTEAELRAVVGQPSYWFSAKVLRKLDAECQRFIAKSPFVFMASTNGRQVDVSPKGDPPGFARVLDDVTIAIPDRAGNRRLDTFSNILEDPNIGLIFLVPDRRETLRVNGRALIVRDVELRQTMVMKGRVPDLALVVSVTRAYFHCGSCIARSQLWERIAAASS
jgi:PPOX class probable FMN-dependent enzyme